MGADWYAPNQQAVRADQSGPAEEGDGGSMAPSGLDAMSKDELLAEAQRLELSPANASMSKAELRAVIDAQGAPA